MVEMTSDNTPSTNEKQSQNVDFKVELVVNDTAEVYLFHSEPFNKPLSWVEFDLDSHNLDFIMDDGDVRNFGTKVPDHLSKHMQNAFQVMMVQRDDDSGQPVSGEYFPLIIHRAYSAYN